MASAETYSNPQPTTRFGKKRKTGIVYVGDHAILKPVNNCVSGLREVDFYTTVFRQHPDNEDIQRLKMLLPQFMGIEDIRGVKHIKLANTVSRYRKPCMLDIKMGHVQSDPYAWPEKAAYRKTKYPYSECLGFSLSGLTVYNPVSDDFEKIDKHRCHNFTPSQMLLEGLGKFFGFPENPRKEVLSCLLHKLKSIKRWFQRQRQFSFYASSLFIVYDGSPHSNSCSLNTTNIHHPPCDIRTCSNCHSMESVNQRLSREASEDSDSSSDSANEDTDGDLSGTSSDEDSSQSDSEGSESAGRCRPHSGCEGEFDWVDCSLVDVRLIDFTHAFRTSQRDDNYLSGLETLITILQLMQDWQ